MDGELLSHLYHELVRSGRYGPPPGCTFPDGVVALAYLYGVMCGRSPRWAADPRHWPAWARRLVRLPSYSQLARRLSTPSVAALVARVGDEHRGRLPRSAAKYADGKALPVGGFSKDPDAAAGRVPGGWGHGYKLHVVADAGGAVDAAEVTPLDAGEPTVARRLLARVDLRGAVVRADSNYDSNRLYRQVADAGGRLVAPRKKPGRGLGHHRQHPDRVRAVAELEAGDAARRAHNRERVRVEQVFAHLTNLPFGAAPLPNFVRRLPRVRRWVAAKIALYHVHLSLRQAAAQAA